MNRRTKEKLRLKKRQLREVRQQQSVSSLEPYSSDKILQLIGDDSTEITDDIVQAAFEVIKANSHDNRAEYMGFYTPAQLHFMITETFHRDSTPHFLPVNKDSLHIHPLSGHWVTSFYDSVLKQLYVYDSLHSLSHQKEVELQLRQIYHSQIVDSLTYEKVTQQSTDPICGVMAIAFAFSCFLRQNPASICYNITLAREHLRHCLSTGTLSAFPALSIGSDNSWLEKYLNMQQKSASAPRVARSRERRSVEKVKSDREKDTLSKSESRKNRSSDKILKDKAADISRKWEKMKNRSPDKILKDKDVDTSRKREKRKNRSSDKILKDKDVDTSRKREKRKNRSPDKILKDKDVDTSRKREKRKNRSPDKILKDKDVDTSRKQVKRKNRSPDKILKDKDVDTSRKQEKRKNRSPDKILKDKDVDTSRKREKRKNRSPDKILKDKHKETSRKGERRKRRSQDKIFKDKCMNTSSKRKGRKRRNQDEILKGKDVDTSSKRESRKRRSQDKIIKDKDMDTASKKVRRQSRTAQQVCKDKQIDKERKSKRRHPSDILDVIKEFNEHIKESPEYICTVCHRTLYRNSVVRFKETTQLSHQISTNELSADDTQYICSTCKRYIDKNEVPPQAQSNRMTVPKAPNILAELTDFEARLLAKRYPFMKIVQLPKGRQRGIIGQVVNVPIDAEDLCATLPRTIATSGIIPVKLKRKKAYKGHVFYQNIRPQKIREAFHWLMKNNKQYQNIVECADWESKCKTENADTWQQLTQQDSTEQDKRGTDGHQDTEGSSDDESSTSSDANVSDDDFMQPTADDDKEVTQYDTCIQPSDPAADASKILTIAPGEGRHPIHIMLDPSCEEQSFPCLFPTGCFGFDAQREVKITPKKYFNARILNKDGNFSKNVEYLFFAQYITEHKQVMDSASVAVRKSYQASSSQGALDASFIKDPERLKSLILKDKAYHFLQTIRGSPPYWQKAMFKLMAAVKQFGIFTFFVTLSSADLKWTDTLNAILRQQGRQLTEEEINDLPWEDRCSLLRSNPVTTARHFDHRLQTFISCILLGKAQPLGKIRHYSYRIEFQQRGSPHAHCVIWTEDAPKPTDSKEIVAEFIDKYITCHIPSQEENLELYNLVTSVQKHHHTATCRKKGTACRFNYPKMPSQDTIIACELDTDDMQLKKTAVKNASEVMSNVMTVLEEDKLHEIKSFEELLAQADVTDTQYTNALSLTKRGKAVILERGTNEIYINCYNSDLLLAWQANLDVQYCVDPYGCIAYMVNYITKDEREMSVTLQNVTKEKQHCDWKEQLKACATAFLNAREVSAQEAVYRLLSFPLFKSSFTTVFVPADLPSKRVAFLKPISMINAMEDEEEDIFATSTLDRYVARPNKLEECCLAHFAISYTTSHSTSTEDSDEDILESGGTISLKNGLGSMKKRSKKAVLRYHHKSQSKEPEEYFYSQLLLFLPWRDERSELLQLSSYEDHYNNKKDMIEANRSEVEHHAEIISLAVEQFETFGPPVHAFDEISPNTEQENQDEQLLGMEEDPDFAVLNPDHSINTQTVLNDIPVASTASTSLEIRPGFLNEDSYCRHLRQLNLEQRDTFQIVYQWCRDKSVSHKTGNVPNPLYLFVSGGAGTGKSHLITAIYQMALRNLQREGENPDKIKVLLTAPTGTAAHNISGTTLHSAFLLPLGQTKSFTKLTDDKINTLRAKAGNLELLIVDEISMVGCNLFLHLHYRMCEIMSSQKPFGGVSVLVFGDLFQLPPVKQKFVFSPVSDSIARLYGSLWENFQYKELTKIMRQKEDVAFAEMLNRVRTQSHTKADIAMLQGRVEVVSSLSEQVLHVFTRNKDVDDHNSDQLRKLGQPIQILVAVDRKPDSLKDFKLPKNTQFTGGLPDEIQLAVGARVMLIRNLDIADGLVNGSQGQVAGFIKSKGISATDVAAVLVKFDSPSVGQNARQKSQFTIELKACPHATPILRAEVSFTVSRKNKNLTISRYQFPLRLCWACTIHKVQGLTTDEIVVSFENRFACGQAYVALSRAKTLKGLHIVKFQPDKIRANTSVQTEMQRLKEKCLLPYCYSFLSHKRYCIQFSVLNIRSYLHHKEDLLCDPVFLQSDVIVLTETWLSRTNIDTSIFPSTHSVLRVDRCSTGTATAGGVAIICKHNSVQCEQVQTFCDQYIQILSVYVKIGGQTKDFHLIAVYSSPNSKNHPKLCVTKVTDQVQKISRGSQGKIPPVICTGDFNQNSLEGLNCPVQSELLSKKFVQHIHSPTHSSGSCLDHIYSFDMYVTDVTVIPCYFSDHHWLSCKLNIEKY